MTSEDEGELMRTLLETPKRDGNTSEIFNKCFETESAMILLTGEEDSHTLDHKIPCGDDSRWSTMWADYLCGTLTARTPCYPSSVKRC